MPDFKSAFERHLADAQILFAQQKWPNADQLFGLSAECALKAIMEKLGMKVGEKGPEDKYKKHINPLWDVFITFVQNSGQAYYASKLPPENPFSNWGIAQRYDDGAAISEAIAIAHKKATLTIAGLFNNTLLDGEEPT